MTYTLYPCSISYMNLRYDAAWIIIKIYMCLLTSVFHTDILEISIFFEVYSTSFILMCYMHSGRSQLTFTFSQTTILNIIFGVLYFKFDLTFQFLIMQFQTVTEHGHQFGSDDFKILPTIKGFINNNCTCKCNLEY